MEESVIEKELKIKNNEQAVMSCFQNSLNSLNCKQIKFDLQKIIETIGSRHCNQAITMKEIFDCIKQSKLSDEMNEELYMKMITCATQRVLQIPEDLYIALVNGLIQQRKEFVLTQLLQYKVIPDNNSIAAILLQQQTSIPCLYYCGLDMLKRMKNYSKLVDLYLMNNNISMALQIANQYSVEIPSTKVQEYIKNYNDDLLLYQLKLIFPELA
ncbi:hypothetical protein ENUP19_0082G0131 [Entamoeba nuttalli]|uniref:Mic1 domain-containing protein n=2 Tax=Entamoeba nuttalli TaxID=412467 RepID=K2GSJ0_ENTNP|nr:hypothetical protein ENU1_180990 [Entamoeba nuttalli P19]EKE37963.1 hypothetical protein ENU1_180990 [Entamoeba nuttalli P19]|eukprot:XP_008859700.1 hypothetical protein ENU1_180990 [Entamoeba nuttalli P19]